MPDTRTTGILAATASAVPSTLIAHNHISNNHFGVFLEALSNVRERIARSRPWQQSASSTCTKPVKIVTVP